MHYSREAAQAIKSELKFYVNYRYLNPVTHIVNTNQFTKYLY